MCIIKLLEIHDVTCRYVKPVAWINVLQVHFLEKSIESSVSLFSFVKLLHFIVLCHKLLWISMMHRLRRYDAFAPQI